MKNNFILLLIIMALYENVFCMENVSSSEFFDNDSDMYSVKSESGSSDFGETPTQEKSCTVKYNDKIYPQDVGNLSSILLAAQRREKLGGLEVQDIIPRGYIKSSEIADHLNMMYKFVLHRNDQLKIVGVLAYTDEGDSASCNFTAQREDVPMAHGLFMDLHQRFIELCAQKKCKKLIVSGFDHEQHGQLVALGYTEAAGELGLFGGMVKRINSR